MHIDDPRLPGEGGQSDDLEDSDVQETLPGEIEELEEPEPQETQQDREPPAGRLERRDFALQERLREVHAAEERLRVRQEELSRIEQERMRPDPRLEEERLANMPIEDRLRYESQRQFQTFRNESLRDTFSTRAELDKLRYEQTVAASPAYRKYTDEVERQYWAQHSNAMRQGNPNLILSRDTILTQMVGQDVRKNGEKALRVARETGQRNIQRATTKTGNVSGNVRPSRAGKSPAEEAMARMRAAGVLED